MNDQAWFNYHRNNGITKIGLLDPNRKISDDDDNDNKKDVTNYIMRPTEGSVQFMDKMN